MQFIALLMAGLAASAAAQGLKDAKALKAACKDSLVDTAKGDIVSSCAANSNKQDCILDAAMHAASTGCKSEILRIIHVNYA